MDDTIKKILTGELSVTNYGKSLKITKQAAHQHLKAYITKIKDSDEYAKILDKIKDSDNKIKIQKIEQTEDNEEALLVFCYEHKKNIFREDNGNVFYSKITKDELNMTMKETISDMHELDLEKAFEANNIVPCKDFLDYYKDRTIDIGIKPLEYIEKELVKYGKPMLKEKLIELCTSKGIREQTVLNILSRPGNNKDMLVNLGTHICETDVFRKNYIDEEYSNKFILAAIAVCEKNDVCSTDIRWIVEQIKLSYSDIDTNKYNYLELKALLCLEPQFKRGVKFNITYLDKQCQFAPVNIDELVEKILEKYDMPVSTSFLTKEINKAGKKFTQPTLGAKVLPKNENITKAHGGWLLKKHLKKVDKFYKELAEHVDIENIVEDQKNKFKVITITDLAKKLKISLNSLLAFYYNRLDIENFLLQTYESGCKIEISGNQLVFTPKK